jgi:hypothetical protein
MDRAPIRAFWIGKQFINKLFQWRIFWWLLIKCGIYGTVLNAQCGREELFAAHDFRLCQVEFKLRVTSGIIYLHLH